MNGKGPHVAVKRFIVAPLVAALLGTSYSAGAPTRASAAPAPSVTTSLGGSRTLVSPIRAVKGQLVDATGRQVRFTGVNWFGFETQTFAPHGLWARNWQSMLDQMAGAGFNTIRLPYSNQIFDPSSVPNGINFYVNPDLRGLTALQLMDKIIQGAGQRGMKVILDQHRPDANAQSELWHAGNVSDQRWIDDWTTLARRYKGNPTVIGADLHNEPHGTATWGDGNPQTDWRLAAERGGNAILAVAPNWLIIVEGIDNYQNDYYWWGGDLAPAIKYPVRLSLPGRLVYSAHDYGPSVFDHTWFHAPNFPNNLPGIWDSHWAYLQLQGIAPVLLGEFGGSVDGGPQGQWQRTLVSYLAAHGISYTYWCWNADSGDTGGILNQDWTTIDHAKLDLLSAYHWPPPPGGRPAAA
jgi:endoglucanase